MRGLAWRPWGSAPLGAPGVGAWGGAGRGVGKRRTDVATRGVENAVRDAGKVRLRQAQAVCAVGYGTVAVYSKVKRPQQHPARATVYDGSK